MTPIGPMSGFQVRTIPRALLPDGFDAYLLDGILYAADPAGLTEQSTCKVMIGPQPWDHWRETIAKLQAWVGSMQDLEPEIGQVVDEEFWSLIEGTHT